MPELRGAHQYRLPDRGIALGNNFCARTMAPCVVPMAIKYWLVYIFRAVDRGV